MAHTEFRATETTVSTASALDRLLVGGRVLCDGAMGTMLDARGISVGRCYDELNLSQPETIAFVHAEYLLAGAEIIETNTFGANAYRLMQHGFHDRVRDINLAGVCLARQCVAQIGEQLAAEVCVAGAIGPLGVRLQPLSRVSLHQARVAFAEQILALADGGPGAGVDLLIIETMTSLAEAGEAIHAAQQAAPGLRIVVMMTMDKHGNCLDGASAETAAVRLTELGADAVGCNCSDGPAIVLRVIERMRAVTGLPLAAMPNAGMPLAVEGRTIYMASPDYMASFAGRFIRAGVNLIGGCCGTTPNHTRAMRSAMRAIEAQGPIAAAQGSSSRFGT